MFKISPQRVSAALFIALLSFAPLTVIAQETPPQNDSAPMLDLTRQPTAVPSFAAPSSQPSSKPSLSPTAVPASVTTSVPANVPASAPLNRKTSNPASTQNPDRPPRNVPATASATPSAGVQANTAFDNPASTESAESTENAENTESAVEGANIPPDPNVLDNAIHTPIYTRPMGKEPAPLDAPSNTPEKERSAYSILAIVLWTCFLIAAAATGYFLYIRFSDKD